MNLELKSRALDLIEEENSLLENSISTVKSMESRDNYLRLIHLSRMGLLKEQTY